MKITVFTPTYNRAYILENLYRSLQRQTFRDFEWLIVDDGSSDNTKELVLKWQKEENHFLIRYFYKENGGKHRAINYGVERAEGELFFIVDSDDYLTNDSLEKIAKYTKEIENDLSYCGVCGLKGHSVSDEIGTTFEGKTIDITMLDREKYGIQGDKAEVFYTSLLKCYPFPSYDGETFLTECVVWDKIANDGYKMRFFNEIIYIGDYLSDGLTTHSDELFLKNPKGYGLYLYQSFKFKKMTGMRKWTHIWYYYLELKDSLKKREIAENLHINRMLFELEIIVIRILTGIRKALK